MVQVNDINIKMGGEAGQGVESSGAGFVRALAKGGLYIYGLQDYQSRIRGGHNFYQIRASEHPISSFSSNLQMLMAFDNETITEHAHELVEGGAIIFDEGLKFNRADVDEGKVKMIPAPLKKIAKEVAGDDIMANTAALGVLAGITGYEISFMEDVIRRNFKRKGEAIVNANLEVVRRGYAFGADNHAADYQWKLQPMPNPKQRMVLTAHQAFCMGAVAAGCRFNSAYPMTPGTTIIEWMTAHAGKYDILTKQTEDELAAILMAIGAAHAGVRALTNTSGGGFDLMTEALGLAGMTETPVVIVEAQRGGPSTGLPTKTEQPDLEPVIHAGHGEFPRLVMAPGNVLEAFHAGYRSFNLAEKYQMPCIVLTDMMLSTTLETIEPEDMDFSQVKVERGEFISKEQLDAMTEEWTYLRHAVTPSGVSPRAVPGHPKAVYITTGDEHDERGYITEDPPTRVAQMDKRMRKLEGAVQEIAKPTLHGPEDADLTLIGWGSTYGAMKMATDMLNAEGIKTNFFHYVDLWPFPAKETEALFAKAKHTIVIEQNFTGQLARLMRVETGCVPNGKILRYDGHPFSQEDVVAAVKKEVNING